MAVTISGMFGNGNTYFVDSPVVIDISGLEWPTNPASPFNIVRVEVIYNNKVVGDFKCDTGGQNTATFDISSALRAIWSDYTYTDEVREADSESGAETRGYRSYSLIVYTEFLQDGEFTTTTSSPFTGGSCAIGHLTEWERSIIPSREAANISYWNGSNKRYGDASTKPATPTSTPERVGLASITSWVDLGPDGTTSHYYPADAGGGRGTEDSPNAHAPLVIRDSQLYADFLFVNRRGAVETCSGTTNPAMDISVDMQHYSRTEGPSFQPTRSLMAIGSDGRRSWQMSSGYVDREWAEWWTTEFLGGKRKQWWMLYKGRYVPVIVEPAKKQTNIYDLAKQQLPHVDFTVTLALEG